MAINSFEDLENHRFFTTHGDDIWERVSSFAGPSGTLKCLKTGQTVTAGVGALNFDPFVGLKPVSELPKEE